MRLHIHKWKFLTPQTEKIQVEKSHYYSSVLGGSSVEEETKQVTHLRRVCEKCGYIKTQTIDGTLSIENEVSLGVYDGKG